MTSFLSEVIDPFNIGGENSSLPSSKPPNAASVGQQYAGLVNAFAAGEPTIYGEQAQFQPQFENLDLNAILQALPTLTGATTAANTGLRTGNMNDFANLAPGYVAAIKGANPGQTALTDALTKTATDNLNLGTTLDPNTTATITNGVRNSWASRGLGASMPAGLDEAVNLVAGGQNLLSQREGAAGSVANMNANLYEDPLLTALGVSSNVPAEAGAVAEGAGPTLFPANQSYDMFNTAYNANAASSIANANNAAAVKGAGLSY